MAYEGYRPILPGQDTNSWKHNVTGEEGVYSNWSLQSSEHLLDGAPLNDHVPGTGRHPHGLLHSQMYEGTHRYAPMELARYNHGGQNAPYLRHARLEFHGVEGANVFPVGFGHDGTRELSTSRWSNFKFRGVPSAEMTVTGHAIRYAGDPGVPSGFGRDRPFEYQGVGDDKLEDAGLALADKPSGPEYAFQKVQEWHGVPSAKAL